MADSSMSDSTKSMSAVLMDVDGTWVIILFFLCRFRSLSVISIPHHPPHVRLPSMYQVPSSLPCLAMPTFSFIPHAKMNPMSLALALSRRHSLTHILEDTKSASLPLEKVCGVHSFTYLLSLHMLSRGRMIPCIPQVGWSLTTIYLFVFTL